MLDDDDILRYMLSGSNERSFGYESLPAPQGPLSAIDLLMLAPDILAHEGVRHSQPSPSPRLPPEPWSREQVVSARLPLSSLKQAHSFALSGCAGVCRQAVLECESSGELIPHTLTPEEVRVLLKPSAAWKPPEFRAAQIHTQAAREYWEDAPQLAGQVRAWLRDGYRIQPSAPVPPIHISNPPFQPEHEVFVRDQIATLLCTGAVSRVTKPPHVCVPIFCVDKKGDGDPFRMVRVHDCRAVNLLLKRWVIKYETLQNLRSVARPGDLAFTIDFKSGYHHVSIHPRSRGFLGFEFGGMYFHYNVVPFGLRMACAVFTKLMKQVAKMWRSVGVEVAVAQADGSVQHRRVRVRCVWFLDDIAVFAEPEIAEQLRDALLLDLQRRRITVATSKSSLIPAVVFEYLGLEFDLFAEDGLGRVRIPQAKLDAMDGVIAEVAAEAGFNVDDAPAEATVRSHSVVAVRLLASLVGRIIAMAPAVLPARLLTTAQADRHTNTMS
mmetsp:Transcript_37855/g.88512  ORF Transcript_37855/g.88512 Transcript_37855/m.88512 type:complete len:495 (+) Transcript_37855:1070-2554(+)